MATPSRRCQPALVSCRLLLCVAGLALWPAAPAGAQFALPASGSAPWRVGLQVGHWKTAELPASLARLRTSTGTGAAGRSEVNLNYDMATRTAAILRTQGVIVDLLPSTVPTGYRADAFVAIHADGNDSSQARGYKIATRWRSSTAPHDQLLVDVLERDYAATTGLPHDHAVTRNMRGYYAINTWLGDDSRISDATPAVVIETGYMTNAADRTLLFNHTDLVARGIARGILDYLGQASSVDAVQARLDAVATTSPAGRSVYVVLDGVPVRAAQSANTPVLARTHQGDGLLYLDTTTRPKGPFTTAALHGAELAANSGYFRVGLPGTSTIGYISRDAVIVQHPQP